MKKNIFLLITGCLLGLVLGLILRSPDESQTPEKDSDLNDESPNSLSQRTAAGTVSAGRFEGLRS